MLRRWSAAFVAENGFDGLSDHTVSIVRGANARSQCESESSALRTQSRTYAGVEGTSYSFKFVFLFGKFPFVLVTFLPLPIVLLLFVRSSI